MASVSSDNTASNAPKSDVDKYNTSKIYKFLNIKCSNPIIFGVLHALGNAKFMYSPLLDSHSKQKADIVVNNFIKDFTVRTLDINKQCIILWIETYLDNTKLSDAGSKLDEFILTYG